MKFKEDRILYYESLLHEIIYILYIIYSKQITP